LTVYKIIRKERAAVYLQEPVTFISQGPASYANTRRYIIKQSDRIGFRMAKPWEHTSSCHDHDYTIALRTPEKRLPSGGPKEEFGRMIFQKKSSLGDRTKVPSATSAGARGDAGTCDAPCILGRVLDSAFIQARVMLSCSDGLIYTGRVCVALFSSNRYWGIVTVPGSFLKAGDLCYPNIVSSPPRAAAAEL